MRRVAGSVAGFTLIEVLLVVVIIGIMSAVAFKSADVAVDNSRWDATTQEMERLAWAIAGNPDLMANGVRTDFGYVGDVGALPPTLGALVANPGGYATWRGPYIRNEFNQQPDDYQTDAWGSLYAYTGGVTITSSGSGGNPLTKQFANTTAELTGNTVRGVVTDGQGNPPGTSAPQVSVRILYPNGAGGTGTASSVPSASGNYAFSGMLPQGVHTVTAVYSATSDTIVRNAVVLPRSTTLLDIKFPGGLWAAGGGGGGSLVYVAGTALLQNGGRDLYFNVRNTGTSTVSVSSIQVVYAVSPEAFYESVYWGATRVVYRTSPRVGTGETMIFSALQTVGGGATVNVSLRNFRQCVTGTCSQANMAGTSFVVAFSDGSSITFSV